MEGLPKKGAGKNCAERKEGRNGSHQTRLRRLPRCSGKVTIPHTSASTPPTAMPTMRKGNSTSHTSGYTTKASSASGQHSTNRISQNRKWIIVYTHAEPSAEVHSPQHPTTSIFLYLHILRLPQLPQHMPPR